MRQLFDLFRDTIDTLIKTSPIVAETSMILIKRGDNTPDALGQNLWELLTQEAKPLADCNAAL